MSIDWLHDVERALDNGQELFGCPGMGRNQWIIAKSLDDLRKHAKRAADARKMPVQIMRLVGKQDTVAGDLFLVPTAIEDVGARGEPNVKWSTVETKEAAEMMRDVRHGPCPFFGMQVEETVENSVKA
jgi:hypothetical protein